ncbi:MAG: hybrid sensor histidine kinase/response regulator [Stenotrophomonas acidaminiphila]|nr:MAG: hybrid sensor histidine kinase/response regulator [Stenotrophomonas acidaminiphila]
MPIAVISSGGREIRDRGVDAVRSIKLKAWGLWLALGSVIVISILAAAHVGRNRALAQQGQQIHDQLKLRAENLLGLIDRYRVLPTVLALDPELGAALLQERARLDTPALNAKLERANGATRASTLTLIDHTGLAIAANNWREPSSNVGRDYSFRPYFQLAMNEGRGTFYAIGVSTRVAGYYISEAVRGSDGTPIGVVVVKITLDALLKEWMRSPDVLLLSDDHDIVFVTNRQGWEYRPLRRLNARDNEDLLRTRQYAGAPLQPVAFHLQQTLADGTRVVRLDSPAYPGRYLWHSQRLADKGWTLHVLREDRSHAAAATAAATAGGIWLPLLLMILFMRQRTRMARQRERSRQELEQMVTHYTEALRSAQHGLVQAADLALHGKAASLEHLPQGVSVVDAQLRLVAWNSRYQEIFGLPAYLLQVGRPIEDIFRFNAKRGWFGSHATEDAIQRRLEHLRGSGSYIHERERADGTVLEIQGNPLPHGGFVTSYADISAYKAAARDLRNLASTLEHRIEESTRDLRAAKALAENANLYKARFVAAAVHDLLQPLNAAKMYLASAQEQLEGSSRELLERAGDSLQAQDALLSSMLDISRLEAGVLEPRLANVALGPLLAELARQSSILAQAQGLTLVWVDTRLHVHTDPVLLRRILQNFLSNAMQYTPAGKVLLGCRRQGRHARIEVWDTGVGIAPAKHGQIFQEFERLDNGLARDARSAGLGLSIVERVARLLDHRIGVRSWPGHGSVFSVLVPLAEVGEVAVSPLVNTAPARSTLSGCRVLCVDDDPRVLGALQTLLTGWGCQVSVASQPQVLVHEQTLSPAMPDVLLMDYQLGEASGVDLMGHLGRLWGHRPPTIVISAYRGADLREKLDVEGVAYLPKPVAPSALRAMLTQLWLAHASATID